MKVVVKRLTDLQADENPNHKVFLEGKIHIMFRADDHLELFEKLNFYWDYLAFHLLDHLIREFSIREVKDGMKTYKIKLEEFRRATPLMLFCQAQRGRECLKPPAEFKKLITVFDWQNSVTLEVVEDFRNEYTRHYSLCECAMMLVNSSVGSFAISWFIPESIIKSLKVKIPENLFKKFNVKKLEISGDLIYPNTEHRNVSVCNNYDLDFFYNIFYLHIIHSAS